MSTKIKICWGVTLVYAWVCTMYIAGLAFPKADNGEAVNPLPVTIEGLGYIATGITCADGIVRETPPTPIPAAPDSAPLPLYRVYWKAATGATGCGTGVYPRDEARRYADDMNAKGKDIGLHYWIAPGDEAVKKTDPDDEWKTGDVDIPTDPYEPNAIACTDTGLYAGLVNAGIVTGAFIVANPPLAAVSEPAPRAPATPAEGDVWRIDDTAYMRRNGETHAVTLDMLTIIPHESVVTRSTDPCTYGGGGVLTINGPGRLIVSAQVFKSLTALMSDPPQFQVELKTGDSAIYTPKKESK